MKQYLDLVRHVLHRGTRKENRTGVDTLSTFGHYYEVDLREGFPLLTTKHISWKNIVVELLWFLSGQTNIDILKRHGCKFWDAWADPETGEVPSAYGNFWRHFPVHLRVTDSYEGDEYTRTRLDHNDQIAWVLGELQRNPMSRRLVVSAWAPGNAQTSKLPPCHSIFMLNVQNEEFEPCYVHLGTDTGYGWSAWCTHLADRKFATLKRDERFDPKTMRVCPACLNVAAQVNPSYVAADAEAEQIQSQRARVTRRLCLHLTQRSCDVALGVPYNIASYALLLSIFSHLTGIEPGIFGHSLVDAHVYTQKLDGSMAEYDHVPGLEAQLTRTPKPLPKLVISPEIKSLADIEALMRPEVTTEEVMRHFVLEGYDPHPAIPFKVAV